MCNMRHAMRRSNNTADSQPTLLGEMTDPGRRRKSPREFDIMAGDHVSLELRFSQYSQDDKPEQHHETRFHAAQQQYHQQWDLPSFEATTTFPLQDWPWSYNVSGVSTQDVDTSIQRPQLDPLLDLGRPQQDAVNKLDVQSLVKPAGEAWIPPLLPRSTNITHGYHNHAYARNSGVMSEPLPDEEICSLVESDLVSKLDSGFYSQAPGRNSSLYRQDINRDDVSEVSAMSGHHSITNIARPPAGRILSDSQVAGYRSTAHHGRRRRSSHPLPPCSICKTFVPKNASDQKYVSSSLSMVGRTLMIKENMIASTRNLSSAVSLNVSPRTLASRQTTIVTATTSQQSTVKPPRKVP